MLFRSAPPAVQQPATRIQTFEEVKDGIAREKAAGTAFKILEQRVGQIRGIMEEYSQYRRAWERAVAEKDKSVKEPEKVNLQEVADKFGFQYSRTGLVNIRTLSSLPIGRSRVSRGPRMQPFEFPNLVRFAPTPNEPDNLGNLYEIGRAHV